MTPQPEFHTGIATDIGKVRQTNEDYSGHFKTINGDIFVVCDGMGGHLGGATAARTATESIRVFFEHQRYENPVEALRQAFLYANSKIFAAAQQNLEWLGMGTTAVAILLRDGILYHAHVGDSRLYYCSKNRLQQLTKDHTVTQRLLDRGEITTKEANIHPRRHELTQALGPDPEIDVELSMSPIRPVGGDLFILCTDGLSGLVSMDAMQQILMQPGSVQQKAQQLVQAANEAGGLDNSTVQIVEFVGEESFSAPLPIPTTPIQQPVATAEEYTYFPTDSVAGTSPQEKPDINTILTDTNPESEEVKQTSRKPDIALIALIGLAAITIGLFIAGWKYMSSDPVENSELSSIQANTSSLEEEATEEPTEPATAETTVTPEKETEGTTVAPQKTEVVALKAKEEAKKEETKKVEPKKEEVKKEEPKKEVVAPVAISGTTITHVVKPGETFRGIANRYNLKYETLKSLNPQIKDVEKDLKSDVTKITVKVKTMHTVGAGDILSVVSKKYDVPKDLIMTANKKTADRSERGEKLIIPLAKKQ